MTLQDSSVEYTWWNFSILKSRSFIPKFGWFFGFLEGGRVGFWGVFVFVFLVQLLGLFFFTLFPVVPVKRVILLPYKSSDIWKQTQAPKDRFGAFSSAPSA